MNRPLFHSTEPSKRGVALIIVLGFLSIMILMALAFLTQARTERLVANSTLEAQRGRQLVRTALNAAMNDYSSDLFGQKFILPPAGMEVYPSIPPTALTDMGRTLGQDNITLMQGEARQWIPRRYLTAAVTTQVANAKWILVRDNPADNSPTNRILGRYAYVCFDMSGGIDGNLIALTPGVASDGNATNRASVRDVGMGQLAETADAGEFKRLRSGWHGFDNLSELILLTNGKYNGGEQEYEDEDLDTTAWGAPAGARWTGDRVEKYGAALTSSKVTDLVPYSLAAYRGAWDWSSGGWKTDKIKSCDQMASWSDTDWKTVLTAGLGDSFATLDNMVLTAKDFVDPDSASQPGFKYYPSCEAIPMLNELKSDYQLRFVPAAGTNVAYLVLDVKMRFEVWYPFPSTDNPDGQSFRIDAPGISGGNVGVVEKVPPHNMWIQFQLQGIATPAKLELLTGPTPAQLPFTSDFNGGTPVTVPGEINYSFKVAIADTNTQPTAATKMRLVPDMTELITGDQAGIQIKNPDNSVADLIQLQVGSFTLTPGVPWTERYNEVVDPRLNYDAKWWDVGDGTLGAINAATLASPEYEKEGKYMYCRNGPMKTPGELGFISIGEPWKTLNLCSPEGANMLSLLVATNTILTAIKDSATHYTYYTNGTINPNTSSTNVLLAAFTGLTKQEVPDPPVGDPSFPLDPLTVDEARVLAASMIDVSKTKEIKENRAFMYGSDWVRVPAMAADDALATLGLNNNQRESLVRNTWGLFSPNNSLFTVLVIGQAIKEGPGQTGEWKADEDIITGERRAVALVWRDPTPSGATGQHEMFIRMFKFLDE